MTGTKRSTIMCLLAVSALVGCGSDSPGSAPTVPATEGSTPDSATTPASTTTSVAATTSTSSTTTTVAPTTTLPPPPDPAPDQLLHDCIYVALGAVSFAAVPLAAGLNSATGGDADREMFQDAADFANVILSEPMRVPDTVTGALSTVHTLGADAAAQLAATSDPAQIEAITKGLGDDFQQVYDVLIAYVQDRCGPATQDPTCKEPPGTQLPAIAAAEHTEAYWKELLDVVVVQVAARPMCAATFGVVNALYFLNSGDASVASAKLAADLGPSVCLGGGWSLWDGPFPQDGRTVYVMLGAPACQPQQMLVSIAFDDATHEYVGVINTSVADLTGE